MQWNLVIKRSDITKPSYNKVKFAGANSVHFLVSAPWYNKKPDI